MVRDGNGTPVKAIKDPLIRWKEFLKVKFNHDMSSVVSDMADSLANPYIRS